ncbi:MAG TPA: winged helix-turn-helix domain-containing protein [Steroidobacteraceae bacterium]|nr:winged helix-turn-helix domain-containing protein [Steroidobacteraceae bacterium]
MSDGPNITRIAAAIGDPVRAEMLTALMAGRALTATELATHAGITKQTGSTHLRRLLDARLVTVHAQGRHRYFAITNEDVAQLLERMIGVAADATQVRLHTGPREPALRRARVCYDHLAGELAVSMYDMLLARGVLEFRGESLDVADRGHEWLRAFGIDTQHLRSQRRPLCRTCMDWSERRNHLAGGLGAALLQRVVDRGWAKREHGSRLVTFRPSGERALKQALSGAS